MGLLKKLGAVALGTGSAVGWLATNAAKAGLEAIADKVGNGSITSSSGKTYTGSDYHDAANKCNSTVFQNGFKKAKELWDKD